MRSQLSKEEGVRKKFRATFSRIGKKQNYNGYSEDTILLVDVFDVDTDAKVTDHIWFSFTKGFEKIKLEPGVKIEFQARVKAYSKGYVNPLLGKKKRSTDFKLSHPTKISVIKY